MISGEKDILTKMEKWENLSLKEPVGKAISFVQTAAKANCPVRDGELRESIFVAVEESVGTTTGICFTNKKHAPYVEFGTGPKGQRSHEGISPNIAVSYRQSPWWIHESQVDRQTAELYHWFYIETEEGRFYQCLGQPARPFMYPALKDNIKAVSRILKEELKKQL